MTTQFKTLTSPTAMRTAELFNEAWRENAGRTDRMFAVLMIVQWLGAIVLALFVSPRAYNGAESYVHPHVWLALYLGAVLTALPVYLAWEHPGRTLTRHVIAIAQIMFSSLLIQVTGGRIETHFHVFGSLAFLAFYRDWKVLVPATVLVAMDHFVRGVFWPQTVFGIATAAPWRWLEHAAWVLYEDVFLVIACVSGVRDMWSSAVRTAELERMNRDIQQQSQELQVAKEAAEAASHAKSAFLANMSHEIRTPLNAILGFTDVLVTEGDATPQQQDYLQTIHTSGRHLLTLINDVLDLSKIEAGQMEMETAECSPHEIIAATISILRVPAQERGLMLEYFWKSEIPDSIQSDPARLRQILMNLIGNAIKFTEVGSVQVAVRLAPGETSKLIVDVIDTGVGIEPAALERIFDPFVQADTSITRRFGGTGLGLSISRRLARLLGGDLTVNSEFGRGSIFTLSIPTGPLEGVPMTQRATADVVPSTENQEQRSVAALPPCRILLVEDGVTNRKLISILLERAGASVRCAENGLAGLETVAWEPFDLILMDMQMPVMDGYTATRELRRQGCSLPIIALTAHAMDGDEAKCREAGCSGYLTKPIDRAQLLKAVSAAIRERQGKVCTQAQLIVGARAQPAGPLVSKLPADDPEFCEIIEEFIVQLEKHLGELTAAASGNDFRRIAELAHWLKGAGGTAGFDEFTRPAADLEKAARERCHVNIASLIRQLEELRGRIVTPAQA